jgi:trigger factor
MSLTIENLGALERKISLQFSKSELSSKREAKLRQLGKNMKMAGFRPGKVPAHIVEKQYGLQVDFELSFDHASEKFFEFAKEQKLELVGQPRLEPKSEITASEIQFDAIFEVFPEVVVGDLSNSEITKYATEVTDAEIDNTLNMLVKQRVHYHPRGEQGEHGDGGENKCAQKDDQVTVDFVGKIDGVEFAGGQAKDFVFVLGQGQMLPEFEAASLGMNVGEEKSFPLSFPADYHGKEVAGKTAEFTITMKKVEWPHLPALDDTFALSLGIAEGGIAKVREEISQNLQREITRRTQSLLKNQSMDALASACNFELPKFLVSQEETRLIEQARKDLEQRGVPNAKNAPIPEGMFTPQAEQRVKLGLILNALVKEHDLKATPEQIKAEIEEQAASYEDPQEVLRWYYSDASRLSDIESLVLENNVVKYVMDKVKVSEKQVTFEELSQLK